MVRIEEQHKILHRMRRRSRRRAFFVAALWVLGALVLAGGAGYALIATEVLAVREVRVEGVRLAKPDRVRAALEDALGAQTVRSWFRPDLLPFWFFATPPPSFLESFPMFRDADIEVRLATRTVVVRVSERELYGVWCREGTVCYAFDREGVVFGAAPSTSGALVTKVEDTRKGALAPGDAVLTNPEWRDRLIATLDVLRALRLTPRAITVREEKLREWEVALAEGPTLRFSFTFVPDRLEEALAALSRRADFHSLTYLDFRVRDRLYYK